MSRIFKYGPTWVGRSDRRSDRTDRRSDRTDRPKAALRAKTIKPRNEEVVLNFSAPVVMKKRRQFQVKSAAPRDGVDCFFFTGVDCRAF